MGDDGDRSGWMRDSVRFGFVRPRIGDDARCFFCESRGVASVRVASNGYPGGTGGTRVGFGSDRMDGWMDRDSSDHQKD